MNPAPRGEVEFEDVVAAYDEEFVVGDRRDALEDRDQACDEEQGGGDDRDPEGEALFGRRVRLLVGGWRSWWRPFMVGNAGVQRSWRDGAVALLRVDLNQGWDIRPVSHSVSLSSGTSLSRRFSTRRGGRV